MVDCCFKEKDSPVRVEYLSAPKTKQKSIEKQKQNVKLCTFERLVGLLSWEGFGKVLRRWKSRASKGFGCFLRPKLGAFSFWDPGMPPKEPV